MDDAFSGSSSLDDARLGDDTHDGETELIEAARRGHAGAFEMLFERHIHEVERFAASILRGSHLDSEAADVALDTFVRAWQRIATFRCECPFRNWIYEIAKNLCVSIIRKATRQAVTLDGALAHAVLDAKEVEKGDHLNALITNERAAILRSVIAGLQPREREIILLFFEGYSDREVADAVNNSVNQVNGVKRRVLKKLKALVDAQSKGRP